MKKYLGIILAIALLSSLIGCTDLIGEDGLNGKAVADRVGSAIEDAKDSKIVKEAEKALNDIKDSELASDVVDEFNKAKDKLDESGIVDDAKESLGKVLNPTSSTSAACFLLLPYSKNDSNGIVAILPATGDAEMLYLNTK